MPYAPRSHGVVHRGRVVDPAGAPIAGARLQLVYLGDPHWPEDLVDETESDASGRFAFAEVSAHGGFAVVARHGDVARTFDVPPGDPSAGRPPPPFTVRLGSQRALRVTARCAARPDVSGYDRRRLEAMVLQLHWLPGDDLYARVLLSADDVAGASPGLASRLLPGRAATLPSLPLSARRFATEVRAPVGRVRATLTGGCGVAARELEVSEGEGPLTWDLELPVEGHASLELSLSPRSARRVVFPEIFLGPVRLGRDTRLRQGEPLRFHRLPPGAYAIRGVTCHRPVEVAPSTLTRVTIGPGTCAVSAAPR